MTTTDIASLRAGQPTKPLAEMSPKEQVGYLLQQKKAEIAKMIPRTLSVERLLKVAQIAVTSAPALLKCDVPSLIGAIGQCAMLGLEPNTVLGHAYLVPFNTKRRTPDGGERWVNSVQVIVGYRGLIDLARRSGQIVSIAAHEVCERDRFVLAYGLDEQLIHEPALDERGEIIGFYAIARLKDGGHALEFMSRRDVERTRDASQGWQQAVKYGKGQSHPWGAHFVEMGRKTVIRRLAKYLPLSIELAAAVHLDNQAATDRDQRLDAIDGELLLAAPAEEAPAEEAPAAEEPPAEEAPRRRGRPPGSKNRQATTPPPTPNDEEEEGGDETPPPREPALTYAEARHAIEAASGEEELAMAAALIDRVEPWHLRGELLAAVQTMKARLVADQDPPAINLVGGGEITWLRQRAEALDLDLEAVAAKHKVDIGALTKSGFQTLKAALGNAF
ncbi:MAG TPA: recombinase RecT [Gammaproteobacteria bacterium]|nr:recombinase RecT [Gammaproteobacteria bacterium]